MGKLIAWEKDTPTIAAPFERGAERDFTGSGGIAAAVALEVLHPLPGPEFVTGHLGFGTFRKLRAKDQGKPRLELHLWRLGDTFQKLATARLGGHYTDLDIAMIARRDDDARFVVALRGVGGELKVTVWAVDRV